MSQSTSPTAPNMKGKRLVKTKIGGFCYGAQEILVGTVGVIAQMEEGLVWQSHDGKFARWVDMEVLVKFFELVSDKDLPMYMGINGWLDGVIGSILEKGGVLR